MKATAKKVERALELLRQRMPIMEVAREVGVEYQTVTVWKHKYLPTTCACGEKLREPAPGDQCGFCREEAALAK